MWNENIFNKAMFFAIHAHGEQKMKYPSDMPYSAHLIGVTQSLVTCVSQDGGDIDWDLAVQVALLHDTIEDTSVTYEDILNNFGKSVADGVFAVTKNEELPDVEQMQDCLNKIVKQPKEIAMVKMADRLFNMRQRPPVWSKQKQDEYKVEAQLILNTLGYCSKTLQQKLQSAINNY